MLTKADGIRSGAFQRVGGLSDHLTTDKRFQNFGLVRFLESEKDRGWLQWNRLHRFVITADRGKKISAQTKIRSRNDFNFLFERNDADKIFFLLMKLFFKEFFFRYHFKLCEVNSSTLLTYLPRLNLTQHNLT